MGFELGKQPRPAEAVTCLDCGGTGEGDQGEFGILACEKCDGRGWYIPESPS